MALSPLSRIFGGRSITTSPTLLDVTLARATQLGNEAAAVAALADGANPTQTVQLSFLGQDTNAILEAISLDHPQPRILDAILAGGFRPDAREVQRVMRNVAQQPDFDGHHGPTDTYEPLVRILFKHGVRFTASAQDPRFPQDTQADYIRRHAPALNDLDWASPEQVHLRPTQPPATTAAERDQLTRQLEVLAPSSYGRDLDEIHYVLDRGASSSNLASMAIKAMNPNLLQVALERGEYPQTDDLRAITQSLADEAYEPDPNNVRDHYRQMVRVLFTHGERFTEALDPDQPNGMTLAQRIRIKAPQLDHELDWDSTSSTPTAAVVSRRRMNRP